MHSLEGPEKIFLYTYVKQRSYAIRMNLNIQIPMMMKISSQKDQHG